MEPKTSWLGAPAVAGGVLPVAPAGGSEVAAVRGLAPTPFSAAFSTVTIPAGTTPLAVAVAQNGNVYVGNANSNNVTVISSTTNTVLATVPVGSSPAMIAVAANGNVYVTNQSSNNVTVINSATNTVITTVPVGGGPFALAVAPNGNVYVANSTTNNTTVINSTTNTVITTVPVGAVPDAVAVAQNGNVYVANRNAGTVTVIDSATNTVITTLPTGGFPGYAAVAQNGNVYIANQTSNNVTVINSATNTVIATVPAGTVPGVIAIAQNGNVYVTNTVSNNVTVIDSATNTVIATVGTGSGPFGVAVAPTGNVYVGNSNSNNVTVISSTTNTVVATVPVGAFPFSVAAAQNSNVYVSNANSANVTEISPLTVTNSPASPVCGQPVTFNISGGTPNGTAVVDFGDASPTVTVPLDAGGSGQTTHTYAAGMFTAKVNGNPTSLTVSLNPTSTMLSVTPNPSTCGQSVTVCATITPAPGTTSVPTGTVTFTLPNGGVQVVPVNASGQACFNTTALTTGTLTAVYSGDSCFSGSNAGTPVTVNPTPTKLTAQPGTIRLRLTPLPEFYIPTLSATLTTTSGMPVAGQPVTFTATTLFGPVNLGTAVTDANGTATIHNAVVPPYAIATPFYTATFPGNACYTSSTAHGILLFIPLPG